LKPFLEALDERVLIADGATGTMLYAKGVFLNRCFDELNLTQPDLVADLHQAYVRAGADVIETNTFGANRIKLASFGLESRLASINEQGARLARSAARAEAYVAGAIGPLGIRVEPFGKTGLDEAEAIFREQAEALAAGGVDLFMLETFRDLSELGAAVRACRAAAPTLPIVAQLTTGDDGHTLDGMPPEKFTPILESLGADVIGLNCSVGPAAMLETLEHMAAVAPSAKLSAQPNAGRPRDVEGRNIYLSSPEYMASYARRFIASGVKLVGGCCGTTPEHVRHIKLAARALTPVARAAKSAGSPAAAGGDGKSAAGAAAGVAIAPIDGVTPVERQHKSRFANALARGQFVITVDLAPPRGYGCTTMIDQARELKIRGVDAITISEQGGSGGRMSPLAMAVLVEQRAGIETVLQHSCRDYRLSTLQSSLLGAHAMGVRNLLIVTGDPVRRGEYPDANASVLEVDSIGLTNAVTRLNQGIDIGGQAIGKPTAFHTGVMANPGSVALDDEIRRFMYKVEAGAEFAVTRPIYDVADLELFLKRIDGARIPIVVGLRPFESLLQAEFLANEVPGIRVPDRLVERMRRAEQQGRALDEGLAIARELVEAVRPLANGLQIIPPMGRADVALALLEG
jgi:methionine synthase I (cobalamin-dependent)/5,10-methylenetetrahydrofolate reductase